jgi:radical SAM superfamily enzyme YgiQ (UPF0313 family)
MRALLVNPWIYDFAAYDLWSKPMGLINIGSKLRDLGFDIDLIDCIDRFYPLSERYKIKESAFGDGQYLTEEVERPACFRDIPRKYKRYGMPLSIFGQLLDSTEAPDIILVGSGLTYWYPGAFMAIQLLKDKFPDRPIILGGIYAKFCFKHAKKFSKADFVFKDESFIKLIGLIKRLNKDKEFKVKSGKASKLSNSKFNLSAYDLYPRLEYITLLTSYGCVFHCSYCGWHILSNKYRQYKNTVDTIRYFYDKFTVKNFAFYDDAMLYRAEKHFLVIFKSLLKNKINANFHTPNGLHCRFITREVAETMKESNFVNPRLALETVSENLQKKSGSKVNTDDFIIAVNLLIAAGYRRKEIQANLIVGLPDQKFVDVKNSIVFLNNLSIRICLEEYSPVPYTKDFDKFGLSLSDDPLHHNNTAFVLRHPEFANRIQELKDLAHSTIEFPANN